MEQNIHSANKQSAALPLKILCFIFPLVGLVLFIVNYNTDQITAKSCGKWALIGTAVVLVLCVVAFLLVVLNLAL